MGSGAETKLCSSLASVESSRDDGCGQSYRSSASSGDTNLASSAQSNCSWRSLSSSHNNETVGCIGSGKVRKSKNLNDKAEGSRRSGHPRYLQLTKLQRLRKGGFSLTRPLALPREEVQMATKIRSKVEKEMKMISVIASPKAA